jgi:predicted outer membrane lipoprotein
MSDIEFELKKRFADLREDEEANAPSFAAVRDRGRPGLESVRSVSPRRRWIAPILLAAAAAVFAALWVTTRMPSRSERARQEARLRDSSMNVFQWTMPTDGLLTSARRTLQTPALSGSVLDAAAVPIPGTPFKGD